MLNELASEAIQAAYPTAILNDDFSVVAGDDEIHQWNSGKLGVVPTADQINRWVSDIDSLPSGKLFSEWLAEHGGDANLTQRRIARESYAAFHDRGRVQRAIVALTVDELNSLRQWQMAFKAAVSDSINLADLKVRVAALPDLPNRTYQQAKNAIEASIDADR